MNATLAAHLRRYPAMELRDVFKLLHQSRFAGGHLVSHPGESLGRLEQEWRNLPADEPRTNLRADDIGGGLCRLYLNGLSEEDLPALNRLFFRTAEDKTEGAAESREGLGEDLEQFLSACRRGEPPFDRFDPEEAARAAAVWREEGFDMMRHSEGYRAAYRPAYRVIRKEFGQYFPLFSALDRLLLTRERVCVALDGNASAGKTTLGALLQKEYSGRKICCNLFHMDDFFLRPEQRSPARYAQAGGNIDYERFEAEVVAGIRKGEPFSYQVFDCAAMKPGERVEVRPARLNIVEGSYSLHPRFAGLYDLKVFLSATLETQSRRILIRNGAEKHRRFLEEWIPLENRYFETFSVAEGCQFVFRAEEGEPFLGEK